MIARIKAGEDPDPSRSAPVIEPTVSELAERYLTEHVAVRCKPRTAEAYRWLVAKFVLPELGKLAIEAVEREHIAALHYRHRETPYQAMFRRSSRWSERCSLWPIHLCVWFEEALEIGKRLVELSEKILRQS